MIRFYCPHCRERFKARDEQAGHQAKCHTCGQQFLIPHIARQTAPFDFHGVNESPPHHDRLADPQATDTEASKPPLDTSKAGWTAAGILGVLVLVCIGVVSNKDNVKPDQAWYEGGTLHNAKMSEWRNAPYHDRLATAADFVAAILQKKGKIPADVNDLKPKAIELERCISKADTPGITDDKDVSEIAAVCLVLLKY